MQHCPISPALASFYNEYHNAALVSAQHDLKACQTLIGYTFNNINLLFEALQAPGTIALSATGHPLKRGNENLAIVGDLALAAVLSAEWYRTDNTSTGHWQTQWRDRLLSDEHLASISRRTGLTKFLQKKLMQPDQIEPGEKQAASLVEAVAGAIFLDAEDGVDAVGRFARCVGLLG